MLIARATAEVARLIAADAILGIPYVTEELDDDDVPPTAHEPGPEAPAPRTARRRQRLASPTAEPAAPEEAHLDDGAMALLAEDEPPFDEPHPATTRDQITPGQRRVLQAGFRDLHIERLERLAIVSGVVGRPVDSANELDVSEVSAVLDEIELRKSQREPDARATGDDHSTVAAGP